MSHTNQTGATRKGQIMKISFDRVHFLIFLKGQNKKNQHEHAQVVAGGR
jgi:hypothetical protein